MLAPDGTDLMTISGTDEYEMMDGGRWMIHRVDVMMGTESTKALEFIGDPDEHGHLRGRAFTTSGDYDETTFRQLEDGAWRLDAGDTRSTLRPDGADVMTALWERDDGQGWRDWMHMRFVRI
ncbi:hypothetical protein [Ilumatobacter sp.]|uniref:hypothetical protein n=1 Tax=Ilumatobacter sp. TaxID=1967498 RepID=UPI003B5291D8